MSTPEPSPFRKAARYLTLIVVVLGLYSILAFVFAPAAPMSWKFTMANNTTRSSIDLEARSNRTKSFENKKLLPSTTKSNKLVPLLQKPSGPASLPDVSSAAVGPTRVKDAPAKHEVGVSAEPRMSCMANRGKDGRLGGLVPVHSARLEKVSKGIFDDRVMQKFGFVNADHASSQATGQPEVAVWGMLNTMKPGQALSILEQKDKMVIFLVRSDAALYLTKPRDMLLHRNLLAIFKEFTVRSASSFRLSKEKIRFMWVKWHMGVICSSPKFFTSRPCLNENQRYGSKSGFAEFNVSSIAQEVRLHRLRTVNWNFLQYYEMEPTAAAFRKSAARAKGMLSNRRSLDVFCAVHLRDKEATPLELHRMSILMALQSWQGPKRIHGCSTSATIRKRYNVNSNILDSKCLFPKQYAEGMLNAKMVVCPWGFGERTGCDVNALLHGAVLLKPWMDWVLAYPDIYQNGTYYVAFEADASDLKEKVSNVLQNYDRYQTMRARGQQLCIESVDSKHFQERFWAQACDAYRKGVGQG